MNIAHLTAVDISLRYFLLHQLAFFKEKQFEVYAISSPGEHVSQIEKEGVVHIPVNISRQLIAPLRDVVSFCKLFSVFRKYRFQIVHTHTPKASFLGQIAAKFAGVPIIIRTVHGFYFHEFTPPLLRFLLIRMEKLAAKYSDLIYSQNAEDIQTAIGNGICPPEKIKYLGNGIDLATFDPVRIGSDVKSAFRDRYGIKKGELVIGFVGRLVEEKGLLELFNAVKIVRKEIPNIKLLLVGPVDVAKSDAVAPATASNYDIADICIFTGNLEDMPQAYAVMELFVLPSHREGFPRSAMEAAAMGVPCILTDIRGCREVVDQGKNGILVPARDPVSLASAMLELLIDRRKSVEMGEKGRQKAIQQFDERVLFQRILADYQDLLKRKTPVKAEV